MSLEMGSDRAICPRCGKAYGKRRAGFQTSHAACHKGIGSLPICKDCVDLLYSSYLSQCNDTRSAVRQMCRKLDLFWSDAIFDFVDKKNVARSVMTAYVQRINSVQYAGKSYDDTLMNEGTLWSSVQAPDVSVQQNVQEDTEYEDDSYETPEDVVAFWGAGYTHEMYRELEQRRSYWMSRLPSDIEMDIGTEALIRQIGPLELDINKARASGRDVDKLVANLDKLIGSAGLKPGQKRQEDADTTLTSTPLGVWLYRYENERPLPEVDEDLRDVNGIRKYVFTWMGHLCKMLGLKNAYSQLYDNEIERLRVEKPEYDGDDESLLFNEDEADEAGDSS